MTIRLAFTAFAAFAAFAALALMGCPPDNNNATKASPSSSSTSISTTALGVCTKIGQSCEYSPGKLGTCVQKDDCPAASAPCFICQSQH